MIFDTLVNDFSIEGQADFTAADAPPLDVVVNPPGPDGLAFGDADGNEWFEAGENLILLKIQCQIPYCFGQGRGVHTVGIVWRDELGNDTVIPEFAQESILMLPTMDGIDYAGPSGPGLMLKPPLVVLTPGVYSKVQLVLTNITLNVSMLGLPSELAGEAFPVAYFLNIAHTRPMVRLT